MSNRTNTNPLLFPASTNSPFEEIQGSAVLIPPSLNPPPSHDPASQQQMPEIDLNESFGIGDQTLSFGRPSTAETPTFSSVKTESDLASKSSLLPQPPKFVPPVTPPFGSPFVPPPKALPSFPTSPYPAPTSVPSFQGPTPISSVLPPFSQTSAPISSVIPPFSGSPGPIPAVPPPTRPPAIPTPSAIPTFPKSPIANVSPSVTPPFPKNSSSSAIPHPSQYSLSGEGTSGHPLPDRSFTSGSFSHVLNPSSSPPPLEVKASTPSPPPSLNMGSKHSRLGTPVGSFPTGSPQGANILAAKPPEIPVEASVTKGGFPSPTSSVGGESYYTPSRENVIPLSFENMATSPALQDGVYHPVMHHWFYSVGQPQVWKPFTFKDSLNLEEAFREGNQKLIPTDGGRYDVSITEHSRKPVYWEEEPSHVRRCSWFKKSPLEAQPVPYEEEMAEQLEAEYRDAMMTGKWHRQVDAPGGDRIMIHSTRTMIHYVGLDSDFASVNGSHSPLSVKRGTEDFEIMDGEADEVDHLLFLVHGIGSVCDLRFRAVEECVDDFRKLGHQLLSSHFKQSVDMGLVGRVEILPVSWHKALHGDATGIDRKLKPITLRSIPKLREFTNDTILDVLLFTSPIYCQHIMDTVASELNRLYNLFSERNPSFKGLVSLGGHSLGSVILFDLLMRQSLNDQEEEEEEGEETPVSKEEFSPHERHKESISSPINYVMGGQGTGQPSLIYPKLIFKPEAFFLMGSPFAMFVTVRGIDTIGLDYELPTCKRVFNIFHPFDPVAYRLETLIDPSLTNLRPVLIPHHKGRKRMHLELKETIERVGTEFKQKIVDSIQGTWNRLYQFYSGSSTTSIEHEVDEALASQLYLDEEENQGSSNGDQGTPIGRLNCGRRIDYVLQEKPYESFNEYIFALQAHVTYWESEDTMLLILKELYGPKGISCDAEHGSQPTSTSAQHAYDGDSALGSTVVTPTSPPVFDMGSSSVSRSGVDSNGSVPQPSAPVPLFTVSPTNPVNMTNYAQAFNFPSGGSSGAPNVIGGRPVVDINSQPRGMDPTAIPGDKKAVGPPPKIPTGTFTRTTPFRR